MFDPRKLMPLSIELCSAPMAVITEITENTPIVIPTIVKAARNLFAPSELSAIFTISLNNMSITDSPQRSLRTQSSKTDVFVQIQNTPPDAGLQ